MKSGKLEFRKIAPTSMLREESVGNRTMPAPEILSGTFQGAIATCRYVSFVPSLEEKLRIN